MAVPRYSVIRVTEHRLPPLRSNYEHIVRAHQNNPQQGENQVSDQLKFNIFQSIMDSLFQSFSDSVSVGSFQELSACVFSWIEEHCKPQVGGVTGALWATRQRLGFGDRFAQKLSDIFEMSAKHHFRNDCVSSE